MRRSGFNLMIRLIGLVRPLTGYMILAVAMGLIGHLCASFITVFGGYAILSVLHPEGALKLSILFVSLLVSAILRGFLRYAEQAATILLLLNCLL